MRMQVVVCPCRTLTRQYVPWSCWSWGFDANAAVYLVKQSWAQKSKLTRSQGSNGAQAKIDQQLGTIQTLRWRRLGVREPEPNLDVCSSTESQFSLRVPSGSHWHVCQRQGTRELNSVC